LPTVVATTITIIWVPLPLGAAAGGGVTATGAASIAIFRIPSIVESAVSGVDGTATGTTTIMIDRSRTPSRPSSPG
jgi:hypothetical protein